MTTLDAVVVGAGQAGLAAVHHLDAGGLEFLVLEAGEQAGETLSAGAVIAATGSFGRPLVPDLPGLGRFEGQVLHAAAYKQPHPFAGQRVVVVGAGNSAVQIAVELADVADVVLATREPIAFKRQESLGKDIHWRLSRSGIDHLPLSRKGRKPTPVLDDGRYRKAIASGRPQWRPMFDRLTAKGAVWTDHEEAVDTVILATGYRPSLDYLPSEAFDSSGWPAHRGGVSKVIPNLGYVGLAGQHGIASATLRGVGPDAADVVKAITKRLAYTARIERTDPWAAALSH